MSYLDVDEILCEEERIPVIFLLDAPGLGHLDNSIDSEDLPEKTRIEIPLWLAVAFGKKNMVNIELPKHFERKMRDEILAGAEHLNLAEFSQYFFEVGSKLAMETGVEDLKTTLQIAFAGERYRSLMMHALSSWNDDLSAVEQNMTNAERTVLREGLGSSKDLHQWRIRRASQLKASSILRKRTLNDQT